MTAWDVWLTGMSWKLPEVMLQKPFPGTWAWEVRGGASVCLLPGLGNKDEEMLEEGGLEEWEWPSAQDTH